MLGAAAGAGPVERDQAGLRAVEAGDQRAQHRGPEDEPVPVIATLQP